MKRSHAGVALVILLGAAGAWLATREHGPRSIVVVAEAQPLEEAASPVESAIAAVDASPDAVAREALWVPEGDACRRAVPNGSTLARISDDVFAAAILEKYDAASHRVTLVKSEHGWTMRDCKNDRIEIDHPLTEAERAKPSVSTVPESADDAGTTRATGLVRVDRFATLGPRVAVYVTVGVEYGYDYWCRGFEAIVRLDEDEIVVEGVGAASLDRCGEPGHDLALATASGRVALLLPFVVSSGESGDFEMAWDVTVPEDGALRLVGNVRKTRGAGNRTMTSGKWLGTVDTKLLDAGAFDVEETWRFVRYDDSGEISGPKRTLVRSYALVDGGLVRSPADDPTK